MAALVRLARVGACVAAIATTLVAGRAAAPANDVARLNGTWNCSGVAPGSVATERYARGRDGSIVLENDVQTSTGSLGTVVETFVFNRAERRWHLDAPSGDDFDGMALTANSPTGRTWTFTGTQSIRGHAMRVRIIYTFAGDGFRRTYQREAGSGWQDDTSYFCLPLENGTAALVRKPSGEDLDRVALATYPTDARDRAFSLVGRWICTGTAGPPSTLTYTRAGDIVKLRTELVIAKKPLNIDETYAFDPATARWTTLTQGNAYRGVAAAWLANTWIFDGTVPSGDRRAPVRMVYTTLGADTFRREYQRPDGDVWKAFHGETCRRT